MAPPSQARPQTCVLILAHPKGGVQSLELELPWCSLGWPAPGWICHGPSSRELPASLCTAVFLSTLGVCLSAYPSVPAKVERDAFGCMCEGQRLHGNKWHFPHVTYFFCHVSCDTTQHNAMLKPNKWTGCPGQVQGRCSRVLIRFLVAEHDHLAAQWSGHQVICCCPSTMPQLAACLKLLQGMSAEHSRQSMSVNASAGVCNGGRWVEGSPSSEQKRGAAGKGEKGKHCWNLLSHLEVTSLWLFELFMSGFFQGSHTSKEHRLFVFMQPCEFYLPPSASQTLIRSPLNPKECSHAERGAFSCKTARVADDHGPCSSTSEDQLECVMVSPSWKPKLEEGVEEWGHDTQAV